MHCTIIDEGASISILSSMDWKDLGSPNLVPTFNRSNSEPLGDLPQIPITLGGKNVSINIMVVQGSLDFCLFLGHDYIYAMKDIMSTLF